MGYRPEGVEGFAHLVLALLLTASLRRLIEPELDLDQVFGEMRDTAFVYLVRRLGIGVPGGGASEDGSGTTASAGGVVASLARAAMMSIARQ